jgi:hypothetical protein
LIKIRGRREKGTVQMKRPPTPSAFRARGKPVQVDPV